jgi:ribonuclease P protein component
MLPKRYRLTRSRDFSRTRRVGRSAGSPLLVLYVAPTRSPELRIGFSVSKRVGNAVIRNRVKRFMREAVRHELPRLYQGIDLVFIARPAAAGAGFAQIQETVCYLLRKTGSIPRHGEVTRNA